MARVFKALLLQLPNALAPVPCVADETGLLHHGQAFGDPLTSDVGPSGEPGDGHRSVITEAGNKPPARLFTPGPENRGSPLRLAPASPPTAPPPGAPPSTA